MSSKTWMLSDELADYLLAHSPAEDEFLTNLKKAASAEDIPPIWIAPEQAALMQIILRLSGAKNVVELGTLAGYSAISMARALPADGVVTTIEIDERHAAFSRAWIDRSDAAGKVNVVVGEAAKMLATMPAHSADAMFIDADKENYPLYVEEAERILRPGGVLMVDNAFRKGEIVEDSDDPRVRATRRCNDMIAASKRLTAVIVPVADGMWLAIKE